MGVPGIARARFELLLRRLLLRSQKMQGVLNCELTSTLCSKISTGDEGITQLLGSEVTNQQAEQLCAAARPLSVAWVTPEQLINDDEDGVPTEQRAAWAEFWKVVEEPSVISRSPTTSRH